MSMRTTHDGSLETVKIGPFVVADRSYAELVDAVGAPTLDAYVAMALHVGGLNRYRDADFCDALNAANVVYADGAAVVLLARRHGARAIERAATTDLGHSIISSLAATRWEPIRIALIGGADGIAHKAGAVLANQHGAEIVATYHGYHTEWDQICRDVHDQKPDVVFVGMGMPLEAKWVRDNVSKLGQTRIITCGGWFGFLVGAEKRAPRWMQVFGLEWVARMVQRPRLIVRYALGVVSTTYFLLKK